MFSLSGRMHSFSFHYSLETGKAVQTDSQTVNTQTQGHIVDMRHFDTGIYLSNFS